MSLWSDAENAASHTPNDVDMNTVTIELVQDGTRNVDNEQGIIEDLEARDIDSAHVILNRYLNHPERFTRFQCECSSAK